LVAHMRISHFGPSHAVWPSCYRMSENIVELDLALRLDANNFSVLAPARFDARPVTRVSVSTMNNFTYNYCNVMTTS
jgi:hypothetical protein